MSGIRLIGSGYYLPEKILSNFDLEKSLDTTDEWIVKRTGIKERRIARPDQATSDLALEASRMAMQKAGVGPDDLDMIIVATVTPDMCCPSAANFLQAKLRAMRAVSFDVTAACSGFCFVLDVARQYLLTGAAKTVLVVGAEVMSRVQDWTDRANCVLWGDGSGAVVLQAGDGAPRLVDTYVGADGVNGQDLQVPGGGSLTTPISHESVDAKKHTLRLFNAANSMRIAVQQFVHSVDVILGRNGLTYQDVTHFVPHQANIRMIQQVAKRMDVDMERFVITIHKYANISAASSAIALAEAIDQGRIKPGDVVCLLVFGGGLTWGSALFQF